MVLLGVVVVGIVACVIAVKAGTKKKA